MSDDIVISHDYPDWDWLVESWGYTIDFWETVGSYDGDHVVGLQDGDRYGFLVIGFGSCSGCDALQAAVWDYSKDSDEWLLLPSVQALSDQAKASVRWSESVEARSADVLNELNGNNWWRHEVHMRSAVEKLAKAVRGE